MVRFLTIVVESFDFGSKKSSKMKLGPLEGNREAVTVVKVEKEGRRVKKKT